MARFNLKMNKKTLEGKSILITGGAGSFGRHFTQIAIEKWPGIRNLVIYSRDEQKHFQMSQEFPVSRYPMIKYCIGDVRDFDRIKMALDGVDIVIHAAAMKHVPIAEYNPQECIKTNIYGAENLIRACLDTNVKDVVALSTDKACAPINLYGATKLVSDKLFIAANNIKGRRNIKFSVVRYGNVMGSNGSVIPYFLNKRKSGILPITDPAMTRFNISLDDGVSMVMYALFNAWGGELFVPKIPSYKIMDLAEAICPNCKKEIIGIRSGEKIHEEMISTSDSYNAYDLGKYYVLLPQTPAWDIEYFIKYFNAEKFKEKYSYNSQTNTEWLSVNDLRRLIQKHVDSNFKIF
ncbi:MAG: UDP-N-acetylglucosamine 4,6-dehydratase (inverting) [Chitinophagales bacterium]|nr:UDP-N-acetylglucosamine 4,6-dehydratase (inverting) [Chitinophagales bacterium]